MTEADGLKDELQFIASGDEGAREHALYALTLIAALFGLTYLLIMVVYGGRYQVRFALNRAGIHCSTCEKQAKRSRIGGSRHAGTVKAV